MRSAGNAFRKALFLVLGLACIWITALSVRSSVQVAQYPVSELEALAPVAIFGRESHDTRVNTTDLSIFTPAPLTALAEQFWKHVSNVARLNAATLQPTRHTLASCPKVYVYKLPKSLRDGDRDWKSPNLKQAFGEAAGLLGHLRTTYQYNLARILEYRLVNSKFCITQNPQEADLYYVPVLPNPKNLKAWQRACQKITAEDLQNHLKHLNSSTACRHFFVVSKFHMVAEECRGWWHEPSTSVYRNTQRIAYTQDTFDRDKNSSYFFYDRNDTFTKYPNLISLPHLTSLHWSSKAKNLVPPWTQHSQRDIFMLYIGRSYHGDVILRNRVHDMCTSYANSSLCTSVEPLQSKNLAKCHRYIVEWKQRAVFCLEPLGDDTARKSIWDSLAHGCIPVLFHNLTDRLAPWLWGRWKSQARVLLDRNEFLSAGRRMDLYELLRSIPQDLAELIHITISRYARNIQYSLDDDTEDGIRLLLEGLKTQAERMEKHGICSQ